MEIDSTRKCIKCGHRGSAGDFYGTRNTCRSCVKLRTNGYRVAHPERVAVYRAHGRIPLSAGQERAKRTALRAEGIAAYGGKCACCGESEPAFLAFDHINNDGAAHRREVGPNIIWWLRRNGYPKAAIQLLCHNCNVAKRLGECPHKRSARRVA